MDNRPREVTRREIRQGAGGGADEHFHQMLGSTELYIYRHPNTKISGFEGLKLFLDSHGCETLYLTDTPAPVGPGYDTIRVTNGGKEIPVEALRRAHNWAHRRNLLHMFFRKGVTPRLKS